MSLTRIKTHFTGWRAWELNPVVIKELRQSVRSWSVTGMLLLLLLVLFVASMAFLVNQSFEVTVNEQLGGDMFRVFLVILAGAGILFIPLYLGVRVAAERQDNNPDLLYISTLSPGRIIRGKFFCGAYVTLLFFSACMPFMALTNLLRGVDLPTVFFLLGCLFILVCALNLAAIFIACLPVTKLLKILVALGGSIFLCLMLGWVTAMAFEFMRSGIGSMIFQREFWNYCLTFFGLSLAAAGLFYVLSVALISPLSANRALVPRLYLTLLWLAGGLVAGICALTSVNPDVILIWTYAANFLLVVALVVTISNQDHLSLRIQRKIPRPAGRRFFAFCFFNGAAGGLVWTAGLTILTYLGTVGFYGFFQSGRIGLTMSSSQESLNTFTVYYPAMMLYLFAYAMFAVFIQRRFLSRLAPKITGVIAIFIAAITALGTNIVLFFLNQLSWQSAEHLQLGNAFNLMVVRDASNVTAHLLFAVLLFLLAFVLNARWFFAQWRKFRPPPETVPPVLP